MTRTALIAAGGYSRSGSGRGPGIEILSRTTEGDGGAPVVERLAAVDLPDPSFVLWSEDGSVLHAVLEADPTRVVAIRVSADGREAEVIGDLALEGSGGCHLSRGTDPSTLIVAQYGAGTVATVRLDAAGVPVQQIDLDDHRELLERGDEAGPTTIRTRIRSSPSPARACSRSRTSDWTGCCCTGRTPRG